MYVLCNIWDILTLIKYSFLIWNSNLTRCLVFYLAALLVGNGGGPFKKHPFCHPSHFCAHCKGLGGDCRRRDPLLDYHLLIWEKSKALSWPLFLFLSYRFIVTSLFNSKILILVENYSSWIIVLGTILSAFFLPDIPVGFPGLPLFCPICFI